MRLSYLPNLLTCIRFLLIIPVIHGLLTEHYTEALYFFVIAGITDALDGMLARWFGWTSYFGSIADPLADKLLLMASFITLYYLKLIPDWLMLAIVIRDLWIMCGAISYRIFIGKLQFAPSAISKLNTFLQIVLVPFLLVNLGLYKLPETVINSFMYLVFMTSVASFFHYTWVWGKRAILHFKTLTTIKKSNKSTSILLKGRKEIA